MQISIRFEAAASSSAQHSFLLVLLLTLTVPLYTQVYKWVTANLM